MTKSFFVAPEKATTGTGRLEVIRGKNPADNQQLKGFIYIFIKCDITRGYKAKSWEGGGVQLTMRKFIYDLLWVE